MKLKKKRESQGTHKQFGYWVSEISLHFQYPNFISIWFLEILIGYLSKYLPCLVYNTLFKKMQIRCSFTYFH